MTILFNSNWYLVAIIGVAAFVLWYLVRYVLHSEKPHTTDDESVLPSGNIMWAESVLDTPEYKEKKAKVLRDIIEKGESVIHIVPPDKDELIDHYTNQIKAHKSVIADCEQINVGLRKLQGREKQIAAHNEQIQHLSTVILELQQKINELKSE